MHRKLGQPIVLIVDDEEEECLLLKESLQPDYFVISETNVKTGKACMLKQHVDFAIVDAYFGGLVRGLELLRDPTLFHIPMILKTAKKSFLVEKEYRNLWRHRIFEFYERDEINIELADHFRRTAYNLSVQFTPYDGPPNRLFWPGLLNKLLDNDLAQEDQQLWEWELQSLMRKAFFEWDVNDSPIVVTTVEVFDPLGSGDKSVVWQMRPRSNHQTENKGMVDPTETETSQASSYPQADVIFKVTLVDDDESQKTASTVNHKNRRGHPEPTHNDHRKWDQYKNVVGGYGLRERRYARTAHLHGQIYAVPYFSLDQTATFFNFYKNANDDEESLEQITGIVNNLFENTLKHFNQRSYTNLNQVLLKDYYSSHIKLTKRIKAISNSLTQVSAPGAIAYDGHHIKIRIGQQGIQVLENPLPYLERGDYPHSDDECDTSLRHGDLHPGNVLVDPSTRFCWFIDYEKFSTDHYELADHVEFEANILFSLTPIDGNIGLLAEFTAAITNDTDITKIEDISNMCTDSAARKHLRKAVRAIRAIRQSIQRSYGAKPIRNYYHALMYEALRAAGKTSHDSALTGRDSLERRWHAFITAAQLFQRVTTTTS